MKHRGSARWVSACVVLLIIACCVLVLDALVYKKPGTTLVAALKDERLALGTVAVSLLALLVLGWLKSGAEK